MRGVRRGVFIAVLGVIVAGSAALAQDLNRGDFGTGLCCRWSRFIAACHCEG